MKRKSYRHDIEDVKNMILKDSWVTVICEIKSKIVNNSTRRMLLLKCMCGSEFEKTLILYTGGNIKSCKECANKRRSFFTRKYSDAKKALLRVYNGIKTRCYSKNHSSYYLYGGRGVAMCDEWLNDFNLFYEWAISNGWKKGLEIDKDILGNGSLLYSPETCKVVTHKENANNRSDNHKYPYKGGFYTTYQLSEMFNIPTNTINYRYNVIGMTMEEIEIRGRKKISKWEKK